MPIAFYYEQPPVKADDAECTDITDPCNLVEWDYLTLLNTLQTTPSVDMPFDFVYVIMNEIKICQKDVSGEIVCNNMVGNPEGGNRSWIDLTDLSAGKNLKQIIDEGISSPLILPSWLNGQPGVSADVFNESIYTDLPPIEGFETLTAKMILVPVLIISAIPATRSTIARMNGILETERSTSLIPTSLRFAWLGYRLS